MCKNNKNDIVKELNKEFKKIKKEFEDGQKSVFVQNLKKLKI
jgi:hypothetical protein